MSGDLDGARKTQEKFSKQCPGVSQARSLVESTYDEDAARRTQREFLEGVESFADATPVVGHVRGIVHYAIGDKDKGDECMKAASRTAAVVATGMATGGAGFVVAGGAAITAGLVTDGVTTGIDSAIHNEFKPSGVIQTVRQLP